MVLPFFYESKMGKNEIKKQVIYFTTLLVVWYDYHISLESLNPKTLNTRLNKSSLRETLDYFEQLLLLTSNISFKYSYSINLTLSIAHSSNKSIIVTLQTILLFSIDYFLI